MNMIIFAIIFHVLIINALAFPVGSMLEHLWAFVNRSEVTGFTLKWQDFKYDWYEEACDWGDEFFRWVICDLVLGFIILFILAFLGSVGLLTWIVGIPLVVLAAMYGVRYFLDNFND